MDTLRLLPLARERMTGQMWRIVLMLGWVVVLVVELYIQAHPRPVIYFSDFSNDYNAALALRHGANPIAPAAAWIRTAHTSADQGAAVGGIYYAYAPIFAFLLVPLTLLPIYPAYAVWVVCSLIFLISAVYACLRVAGLRPTLFHLLPLATAIALIRIVRVEYSLGQVDIFLLFLVCTAFWAHSTRRTTLGAVLLALACVTKPVLLPFVVFLLWKREFRFALTAALAFVGLFLAPFAVLGGQALRDQLDIWRYWSNEYAPFQYAFGPKNVFARLFSPNPYVHPIVNAPALTTLLWLAVVTVVIAITVAVVSPRPLSSDSRTLFEIGLVATALLLISPLTEYSYMIQLVIPLLAFYSCLREVDWRSQRFRVTVLGTTLLWLFLCAPFEKLPFAQPSGDSVIARLYISLGPQAIYFYILIAFFALQLHLLHLLAGCSTYAAVWKFVRQAPTLGQQWLLDARAAFAGRARGIAGQFEAAELPLGHRDR